MIPKMLTNHGNYIISLANVVRWLGQQAEALGVEVFPGFPAAEILYNDDGSVKGVATGNMGVDREGKPTDAFQLGMELHAKYTFFAEGSRGHLGKQLMAKYDLEQGQGSADLRHRHQGTVGDRPGHAQAGPGDPHRRLAAGQQHLWRLLPVPPGEQPGRGRLRGRPGLPEPVPVAVRGIPALQNASGNPQVLRRRQAHFLRRARHHRRRPAIPAEDRVPGRRPDRLRRRLPQHQPHQGQPQRHQDRHAGRGSGLRGAGRRTASTTN